MRPRWRKVIRDLAGHRFRTLLVVLSIAVGIFAITVVMGGRGILLREFARVYGTSVPATISFDVDSADGSVVREVARYEGVRKAEGLRAFTARYAPGEQVRQEPSAGWDTLYVRAMPDISASDVEKVTLEKGDAWPPGLGEIVLERSVNMVAPYSPGDLITVESPSGTRAVLRVTGLVHDINAVPAQFVSGATGYISMETLRLLDEPETFNSVRIVSEDELTQAQASRLAMKIRDDVLTARGLRVMRTYVPEPGSHFLGDIFEGVSLLLLALGVLGLLLSGFLVVTTVQAIMAQQVSQVGIMKAIGARADQITWMYLVMVTVYGAFALVLGMPVGAAAGRWFTDFAADLLNFRVTSFAPPAYVVALGMAVGIGVPLLAAIVPVRAGARMSVVRALNATGMSGTTFGHGIVDRALGLVRGLPRPVALSIRNTFLRKGRLTLTLATLVLASAMVMSVMSVRSSILATVDEIDMWRFDAQFYFATPQSREAVERIASGVEGVTAVSAMPEYPGVFERADETESENIDIIGVKPGSGFVIPRVAKGRWLTSDDAAAIVLSEDVANSEPELGVGSTGTFNVAGESHDFEIVGVVSAGLMGPVAFVPLEHLDSLTSAPGAATRLQVRTQTSDPDEQLRVAHMVEQRLEQRSVTVAFMQTASEQRDQIASELGILVTFLAIMGGVLAIVGVIGLTGTMSINVLESTREIGVMRAIGASHGSIYQIFIAEGVVVALIAWALGAALSYPMSRVLLTMLSRAMGLPLTFSFSWEGVGVWLAGVSLIAVVASLLPAYRAAQVSVRDAIAYE
ncbi:MAG: ABC transporter permease [Coriobacteriia bacterium]|jgi:putative ABC transport system permease protein|nr:ABC transporter permease [Coriobacteriia bacterium]